MTTRMHKAGDVLPVSGSTITRDALILALANDVRALENIWNHVAHVVHMTEIVNKDPSDILLEAREVVAKLVGAAATLEGDEIPVGLVFRDFPVITSPTTPSKRLRKSNPRKAVRS